MTSSIGPSNIKDIYEKYKDTNVEDKKFGIKTCLNIFKEIGDVVDKNPSISKGLKEKLLQKMQDMLKSANSHDVPVNKTTGESMITSRQEALENMATDIMLKVYNLQPRSSSPTPQSSPVSSTTINKSFTFTGAPTPPNSPTSKDAPQTPPNSPRGAER